MWEKGSFCWWNWRKGKKARWNLIFLSGAHLWDWELKEEKEIEEIYEEISQDMTGKRNYIRLRIKEDFSTPALANKLKEMGGKLGN